MTDEHTYTVEIGDLTIEDVEIESFQTARTEATEIRDTAPDKIQLTDGRVCDIDTLIAALEEAKEHGVDTVKVNDDGQARHVTPVITNNQREYVATEPKPERLRKWVEL